MSSLFTGCIIAPESIVWRCLKCWRKGHKKDKLSGYDNASIGHYSEGVLHANTARPDFIANHKKDNPQHDLIQHEPSEDSKKGIISQFMCNVDELMMVTVRNVHYTTKHEHALASVEPLRRLLKSQGLTVPTPSSAWSVLEFLHAEAEVLRDEQNQKIKDNDDQFGVGGDTSMDVADIEQECIDIYLLDEAGMPKPEFFELQPLDVLDSEDGESPDALCHFRAYEKAMERRNLGGPEVVWHHVVGISQDSCSTNTGVKKGVFTRAKEKAPWLINTGATAHAVESACNDAYNEISYFKDEYDPTVRGTYSEYSCSAKKKTQLHNVATAIHENKLLRLCKQHGIRWQESLKRGTRAMFMDWRALCADMHRRGKRATAKRDVPEPLRSLHLSTPAEQFKGVQLQYAFESNRGVRKFYPATITKVNQPTLSNDLEEKLFELTFPQDGHKLQLCKAQLLEAMEEGFQSVLLAQPSYEKYDKLSRLRWLRTAALLLDTQNITKPLSQMHQRDTLLPTDIDIKNAAVQAELSKLLAAPGVNEKAVNDNFDNDSQCYRGIAVSHCDASTAAFQADKAKYLTALKANLKTRLDIFKEPIHKARDCLFNHKMWPTDDQQLAAHGDEDLVLLIKQFEMILVHKGEEIDELVQCMKSEWTEVKLYVTQQKKLMDMKCKEMWKTIYKERERFPCLHRLLSLERKLPMDSSSIERRFSTMNRLKSKWRNTLSQQVLNDLMMVCCNAVEWPDNEFFLKVISKYRSLTQRKRYEGKWRADRNELAKEIDSKSLGA